jgi:ubiquinone/menaquinone biosynthesis C-methylase UbiE
MSKATAVQPATEASVPQLKDTQKAFDSVAADYDGSRGNNALIQDMRNEMWRWLDATLSPGSRLIDLGCGTGLDAIRMAKLGHFVTATDWSPQMVSRTRDRAARERVTERVQTLAVGAHELHLLDAAIPYDGIYSNLGPLNCVPDLTGVSTECARLLNPGGALVFTVIGRICPWEIAHYLRRGRWARAAVRFARGVVPVGMNNHTIWTRYYGPQEFYRAFKSRFMLEHFRGVCLFAPPPYLVSVREKYPRWYRWLWRVDRQMSGTPLLRSMGDHFLIVMRKR